MLQEKFQKRKLIKNIHSIKKMFKKVSNTSDNKTKPIFINNAEWLTKN